MSTFSLAIIARVFNNSEVKGAHFRILLEKVPIFAKNVRFLYHREANKKRHPPLKVAPMCAKAHVIKHSVQIEVISFYGMYIQKKKVRSNSFKEMNFGT